MLFMTVSAAAYLRWLPPAGIMLAPAPILYCACEMIRVLKPFLPHKLFQWCDESCWSSYQRVVLCFFSNLNSAKVIYYGDISDFREDQENKVILSNHQSGSDWVVMDMLGMENNQMGRLRYILKDELKYLPMFGLYFWQHYCVNVRRHGKFAEDKAVNQLKKLKKDNITMNFVIFPEGTRFSPNDTEALKKSQAVAEKKGLTVLKHSLTPRIRGTYLTLTHLRGHYNHVYDITVAYEQSRLPPTDTSGIWTRGRAPGAAKFLLSHSPTLHIHVSKISADLVPENEQEIGQWLHNLYVQKEQMLERFIQTGSFTQGTPLPRAVNKWSQTLPHTCFYLLVTAMVLGNNKMRKYYVLWTLSGSLAGILWMHFH